jgi:hypothetical protein
MRTLFLVLLCVLTFPSRASDDKILIDGQEYFLLDESIFPLDGRFSQREVFDIWNRQLPVLVPRATDLRRQYVATWEIQESRLLLRKIEMQSGNDDQNTLPLGILFPSQKPPIEASWFSGPILIGKGKAVSCVPDTGPCIRSSSPFPKYLQHQSYWTLEFKNGLLASRKEHFPNSRPRD